MMPKLQNKVAIVTGGTGGLGKASVELFLQAGASVVIADIEEAKGRALAQQLGNKTLFHKTDVSKAEEIRGLIDRTIKRFGRLDIMFNNAAISGAMHTSLLDEDFSDFSSIMQVNLLGVMVGTQLAAKHMAKHGGGSIINTSAISGIEAGFGLPCYRAAKVALNHFSKAAAIEFGAYGIRVNCIAPGNITTEMNSFKSPDMNETQQARWDTLREQVRMAPQPLKRNGTAYDVAQAAVFLASEDSAQITGIVLPVDGGITIGEVNNPITESAPFIFI